ncbi:HEAT repeat domain-containing protein [Lysinibacillus sphaericus]|uniref:HEAT repeat domain-containing protein n=1 Tax=Lysinibacillus tabacifolii TaxID=1173107 RepID=A0ABY2STZ3_9BACI|nr:MULTISPECIES: HEAT repeat domain-containing protein [Lysinibacillus]TKI46195.1 HEAT repeat domain-containing protein [Lysinibacillus tabacifolii]UDK98173.1 HEAT repeat domain-containing protein [Lysinibacillus sphaericus]
MIDLSLDFLLSVIAILFIVLCGFMMYIFYQRQSEVRFKKSRDIYLKDYSQLWYEYLFNNEIFSVVLIPRGKPQVQAIEMIFSSYLKNITNDDMRWKMKNFSNQYLKTFYENDLMNKRWSIRMNALYRIADLQLDELLDACKKLETTKYSKEEFFQLLKIYSLFQPELFIQKIKAPNANYSESEYRRLFVLLEEDIFMRFFDEFTSWSMSIQFAVIDTAAAKKNMQYIEKLEQLLTNENDEIKIRALKGLFEIGVIENINPYIPFVTSHLWEVRLMVGKIFKYVPLSYSYPYLEQLLQDENWWVRSQAAKTIAEDRDGLEKLKEFISYSTDHYAVEMAQETIMRKQGTR